MRGVIQEYPEFHMVSFLTAALFLFHQGLLQVQKLQNALFFCLFPQTGYATQKEVVLVAETLAFSAGYPASFQLETC